MIRRATEKPSRSRPATISAAHSSSRPCGRFAPMSSIARPISHGIAAVPSIAMPASTIDQHRSPAVGTKEAEEPNKGAHAITRYDGALRAHLQDSRREMSDAIALRNRFAMVKGAWDEHLRGVPFPALGEGTAEEKIERLEIALVTEMRNRATPETAEQAADAMWTLVHARHDDDPVKVRVTQLHEELARLGHRPI